MSCRTPALVAACLLLSATPAAALQVRVLPPSPRQGDIAVLFLSGASGARQVEGSLGDRPLSFFPYGEEYAALAGIDIEARPGKAVWRVGVVDAAGKPRKASGAITVVPRTFSVQHLTLPKHMVDLDPETAQRAETESARLSTLYDVVTPERLWQGRFTRPVSGEGPGEGFGSRRIINDQPRMPHSGVDYTAELGTPVLASNRGRVALLGEFFFPGRLVVLDHGLGLYTLYFHLDGVVVTAGVLVERGQTIGTVGATGRVTGPHLHFGAQLRRARVNPADLFSLPVRD